MHRKPSIDPKKFERQVKGQKIKLYQLKNNNGLEIYFSNYGQRLISLMVPDKNGEFDDIVLGYSSIEEYIKHSNSYFGAIIGRYANRIAEGKFNIDDQVYSLNINNGKNHLHGGTNGFHNVIWAANQIRVNEIEFSRVSPELEEGYPGNLNVKVTYRLTNDNELYIHYHATTDKTSIVNLTHHSFFNLRGAGNGTINDHLLTINADSFTPINEHLIPTGEIKNVKGTPFDFRKAKLIGKHLESKDEQLQYGNGYDHNYILNNESRNINEFTLAAKVEESMTKRVLEVYTDAPGMQFYGGNFLDNATGKQGKSYPFRGAFCLETQYFPDSPNQPNFPSTILRPNKQFNSTTLYKFDIIK